MGITYSEGQDPWGRRRSRKRTRRVQPYRSDVRPTVVLNEIPQLKGRTLSNILRGAPASNLPNPADVNRARQRMFKQLTQRRT